MRLNKILKTQIIENARKRFDRPAKEAEQAALMHDVAKQIRLELMGTRNIEAAKEWENREMNQSPVFVSPVKALNRSNWISLRIVTHERGKEPSKKQLYDFDLGEEMVVPWMTPELSDGRLGRIAPLMTAYRRFKSALTAVKKDEENAMKLLGETLDRFNTVEALLKSWPEAKNIVPEAISNPLVVVDNAVLNTKLGLGE